MPVVPWSCLKPVTTLHPQAGTITHPPIRLNISLHLFRTLLIRGEAREREGGVEIKKMRNLNFINVAI